ncbi:sigma-70 family RNA polymerase sigma factor [Streptomyces sp. p1417]|uniref:Sigma-70 family RNA polymerase sigma factor n=1 Tax=Streptomyces typhae TaxID=2681492 RepID=A0A6L6X8N2_9ACTN|nr:sigma-70 family RNA polymerase sigma factor [Streptomyces typhae]
MTDAFGIPLRDGPDTPSALRTGLPIDFEGFYLGQQEFFHAFAELHLGHRSAAELVVHDVCLEILATWDDLLTEADLDQRAMSVLSRHVSGRLAQERRPPAFVINAPIFRNLAAIRAEMELAPSNAGLYEAMLELPTRQYNAIVLRYVLNYPVTRIARYMGLDSRTVDYHIRKGRERLRVLLQLPTDGDRRKKAAPTKKNTEENKGE